MSDSTYVAPAITPLGSLSDLTQGVTTVSGAEDLQTY